MERLIDKKRQKVVLKAILEADAEKSRAQFSNPAGAKGKGGIPNTKLKGLQSSDFFQKNNSEEKGYTFKFDGSLAEFKKP